MLGLMDSLHIDKAFLNGHSMGGTAVSGVALNHPDRVHAAVMTCTTFGFRTAAMQRWAAEMIAKIPNGFNVHAHSFSPGFAERQPALHYLYTAMWNLSPPRPVPRDSKAYLASYERMRDAPPLRYDDFGVPILFVSAEHDELQLPWLVEATAKAVRGAKLERIAGSGHHVLAERSPEYNAVLKAFLDDRRV